MGLNGVTTNVMETVVSNISERIVVQILIVNAMIQDIRVTECPNTDIFVN